MKQSLVASTPVTLAAGGHPLSAAESRPSAEKSHPLKIVCVGGHPDDPESGCAGTLARLPRSGRWMVWMKRIAGLIMLLMAEYYFIQMGMVL